MPALDRIATAVATVVDMPTAMITVVRDGEQVLAAAYGLPAGASNGHLAAPMALCREVASGRPILMQDARRLHRGGAGSDAVAGYGGVPIVADDRLVAGTLAAFGPMPRTWRDRDLVVLRSFADVVAVLLETRHLAPRHAVLASLAEARHLSSRDTFLAQGNVLIARVRGNGVPGIVVGIELDGRDATYSAAREDLMRAAMIVVRACFRDHAVVGHLGGLQLGVVVQGVTAAATSTVVARLAAEMAQSNSRRPPGLKLAWRVGIVDIGTAANGTLARLLVAADLDRSRREWNRDTRGTRREVIILPGELRQQS